ncbi:gastric inhibitory polypeptide receptor-like [Lates japonicus]
MKASDTFIIFFLLCRTVCVSGRTMKDTQEEWRRYKNECDLQINAEPTPGGLLCRRMFDRYACWSDGQPNSTVKVPCPWYLPWYDQVRNGFVLRECGPDGQWATRNSSSTWSDTSQCEANITDTEKKSLEKRMMVFTYFRVMYTVGYCVSLASLSLALIILLLFRKLHCTRNYIHTNLFASFILRAVSILTRDALLSRSTPEFRDNRNISTTVFSDQAGSGCCVAQVLMHYCVGANYYWLLVEGLYLHNLLVMMGENRFFRGYLLMGWGTPVLFVIPWIIVRYLFENTKCWEMNENMTHWWIIRTPILLAILVNFFIFIRIIQILVSKLKAHQMRYTDFKFRLAKSTLTLIALLGIHEVVFSMLTEHTEGVIRDISLFFQLLFSSFHGLFVAILYCFVNKEVQAEIRRKWHRWKLGMTDLDVGTNAATCQISTCSDTKCWCHHPSPCFTPAHCQEDRCLSATTRPSALPLPQLPLPHPYINHQDQLGARQLKTYCYISAHIQDGGGGENEKSCESYC